MKFGILQIGLSEKHIDLYGIIFKVILIYDEF